MNGLNPEPCASYGLADRFVCGKCGITPRITKVDGRGPVAVTFECHGETTSGVFTKEQLRFTCKIFDPEALNSDSGIPLNTNPNRK